MWRLFSDVMHDCGVHCIEHTFNYFVCHVVIDAEQNRNIVISILPYRLSYRANVHMKHSLNTFRGTVLSVLLLHSQVCKSHTLRSRGCFSQRLPSSTFKMKPSIAGFTRPHFNWVSPTARMWLSSITVLFIHTGSFKNTIISTLGPSDSVWVHSY